MDKEYVKLGIGTYQRMVDKISTLSNEKLDLEQKLREEYNSIYIKTVSYGFGKDSLYTNDEAVLKSSEDLKTQIKYLQDRLSQYKKPKSFLQKIKYLFSKS